MKRLDPRAWLLASLAFLAIWVGASVATALSEPSLGWRFVSDPQGQGVLAYETDRAVKISQREQAVAHLVAIRTGGATPGETLALDSLIAVEAPSMLAQQADLDRFFVLQSRLWALLEQARAQGVPVELQTAEGQWLTRTVRDRDGSELGWLYWVPLLCGALPFVIGVGVGSYRWANMGARFLALASVMLLLSLAEVAVVTGRLWLLPPWFAQAGQVFVRCTSLVGLWAFAAMVLYYPSAPRRAALWTRISLAVLLVLVVFNALEWPASQTLRYKLWLVVLGLGVLALAARQALVNRQDPVHRAAARWLAASAVVSLSIVIYAFLVSLVFGAQGVSNSYRWISVPLLYVGLVLSVGRANMFELERWWVPLVLWYLGGTLVVAVDLSLVALLQVDAGAAITVALLVIGWLYFPARQWLLDRLRGRMQPDVVTYVPDLIGAINAGLSGQRAAAAAWREVLQRVFGPQSLERVEGAWSEGEGEARQAQVRDQGRQLWVADVHDPDRADAGRAHLRLTLAHGGRVLFTHAHADMAGRMWELLHHGLQQQRQVQQAVEQERQRIAADLHDDLGARLLGLVQAGRADGTASMARQALEDMRQSVRGMAGRAVLVQDALADWRSELMARLDGAGLGAQWDADEPSVEAMLSPRVQLELARVLREAVSNCIRHSGGTRCRIELRLRDGRMHIVVEDDGRGLPPEGSNGKGLGLQNFERRARKLGGSHRLLRSPLGGLRLEFEAPLSSADAVQVG